MGVCGSGVLGAGVPDEEIAVLNVVASTAIGGALVDAVDKVDTPADGVAFDDSVAHIWCLVGGESLLKIVCSWEFVFVRKEDCD